MTDYLWLKKLLAFCGIYMCIDFVWSWLELIEFGHAMPTWSDTIIGALFAYSVYRHIKFRKDA